MKRIFAAIAAILCLVTGAWADTFNLSYYQQSTTVGVWTLPEGSTTLTGTFNVNSKLQIPDGATVTLSNATIDGAHISYPGYATAGINCLGNATIILEGENLLSAYAAEYPGIYVPPGKTLTIKGSGTLNATGSGGGAGIGGGHQIACGNIVIKGGTITAKGGAYSAGIGSGYAADCGYITINSGVASVVATGGGWTVKPIGAGHEGHTDGGVTVPNGFADCTSGKTRTITPWNGDLATLTGDGSVVVTNGMTITGTLSSKCKITIAANASVTLDDATINGASLGGSSDCAWAGITCEGANYITIANSNTVSGFYNNYPGIHVPSGT